MTTFARGFLDTETRNTDGPLRFILSSPGVKRDGLELDMTRWNLTGFNRNPVAKWNHGFDPLRGDLPIGRWRNVRFTSDRAMVGDLEFDQEDEFARAVESKYQRGFLNAVSIGFIPGFGDRDNELLEASAVAVPADPDALISGRSVVLTSSEYERLTQRLANLEDTFRRHRLAQHIREYLNP
jgi:hypothetical protein